MSRIEQLIAELCQDGVEDKELGECLKRTKGTPITAKQMSKKNKEGAPIKIFAGGKTVAYVDYGDIPEKDILTNKSIVVKSRGNIEFEYIDKPFSHKNEFWSYHSINSNINIKFVFYYLKCNETYFQLVGKRMSKMPQLSIPDTDKFPIPIPPLPIQQEIVRILDTFTDLDAELQAELEARKKQYEHYRNQLLNFEGKEVEWKTLGEVCKFSQGIQIGLNKQTTEYQEGKLRFIRIIDFTQGNQVPRYVDINDRRYLVEEDDISMVRYGEAGFVCTGLRGILANNLFKITPLMEGLNKRFLYHALKSSIVQTPIKNSIKQGSLPAISFNIFKFISIPTPPLPEQERIVSMLDKFEALVNEELPAEISARRKQYEHYREKLLTFEPPVS